MCFGVVLLNTANHLYIAKIVYRYLKKKHNCRIMRSEFFIGNIAPDFYPNVVLKPHTIKNYSGKIKREMWLLYNSHDNYKSRPEYFLRLGRVCHYISDFFCYAHNKSFTGTSRDHFKYEYRLLGHCKLNIKKLYQIDFLPSVPKNTDFESFFSTLTDIHKYFVENENSHSADIFYAVYACVMVILAVR